ncbi:MAG: HD domain-containing protein [Candidatus Pacebacteria bacterium]|nr:HD domain-containing protein [Candidatus Paceibacterota bacterium]
MKTSEIYAKYQIPSVLRNHMYRVAAVARILVQSLKHEIQLDIDLVTKAMLLHDMGNIIKSPIANDVLYTEEERKELRRVEEFIKSYGDNEHTVTMAIAHELNVPEKVLYILENIGSSRLHLTVDLDDLYIKLCSYSDFRVAPTGIVSVEERFDEVIRRYAGSQHALADVEKTEKKKQLALVLEKQIQEVCNISLNEIDIKKVEQVAKELEGYEM